MQLKLSIFALGSLSVLAAANPVVPRTQCNTGNAECCNSVLDTSDPETSVILGLLGIVLNGVTGLIGLGCTPIDIVGIGSGTNCAQQPVCCTGTSFRGLVNIGCSPISL